jgi:hypothetical protein
MSTGDRVADAQAELDQALALAKKGQRGEAGRHAVRAYEILYFS